MPSTFPPMTSKAETEFDPASAETAKKRALWLLDKRDYSRTELLRKLTEKGFADAAMNSFNHYANGAVGEFIFSGLGGVSFQAVDEEGRAMPRVRFRITPDPRIGFARSVLETPCGEASSEWHLDGERLRWHGLVPPNTVGVLEGFGGGDELLPGEYDFDFQISVSDQKMQKKEISNCSAD